MRMPPLPADSIHARACKLKCEKILTRPSGMFAVYHIAMIGMSFPPLMLLLALIGLAIGGLLFDYVDSKNENIYHSWVIHMFADFAIMTIWYLYI